MGYPFCIQRSEIISLVISDQYNTARPAHNCEATISWLWNPFIKFMNFLPQERTNHHQGSSEISKSEAILHLRSIQVVCRKNWQTRAEGEEGKTHLSRSPAPWRLLLGRLTRNSLLGFTIHMPFSVVQGLMLESSLILKFCSVIPFEDCKKQLFNLK